MEPELVTRFVFNDSVILEIVSDEESIMMCVSDVGDKEDDGKCVHLYSDEIDLLIGTLNLYKARVKPRSQRRLES